MPRARRPLAGRPCSLRAEEAARAWGVEETGSRENAFAFPIVVGDRGSERKQNILYTQGNYGFAFQKCSHCWGQPNSLSLWEKEFCRFAIWKLRSTGRVDAIEHRHPRKHHG